MCEAIDTLKGPKAVSGFSGGLESLEVTLCVFSVMLGTSLVVQQLRPMLPNARGPGFDPLSGNQSLHVPAEDPAYPNEDPTHGS